MNTKNKEFGFGDFSSLIFIAIFTVIGGLFIIRIFAASKPIVTLKLAPYNHTDSKGQVDYKGVRGSISVQNAKTCSTNGDDLKWIALKVANGNSTYDSGALNPGKTYMFAVTCDNSAGSTVSYQRITIQ